MTNRPDHIRGQTYHGRQGGIRNAFTYGVDFLLFEPERTARAPFFSHNRTNLWSVHDRNHGGQRGKGRGAAWVREQLAERGYPFASEARILLLTQPSFLGITFNPVSFWLVYDGADLRAVLAEVNNTMGDRHSYLCAKPDWAKINPQDRLTAQKIFHVSPFQAKSGTYSFHFNITETMVAIRIKLHLPEEGIVATLQGHRAAATAASLLGAAIRRPLGAVRVLGLIHWQAVKLYIKGAPFRPRPAPPKTEVS